MDYLKAFDDYSNKKAYVNVSETKPKMNNNEEEEVMYDNVTSVMDKRRSQEKDVMYDNVASVMSSGDKKGSPEKEVDKNEAAANESRASAKSEAKVPMKIEGDSNVAKPLAASESEAKAPTEDQIKAPPQTKPKPSVKDRKAKGAEGGGSVKERKKASKKGSKKQQQLYENIMFDTKL